MSERNDGGPAFPIASYDHQIFGPTTIEEARRLLSGMTLRDYFAAQALQGMLADLPRLCYGAEWKVNAVHHAFDIADLMLAERSKS